MIASITILSLVAACASGLRSNAISPNLGNRQIVGGGDANIEDYPYLVTILYFGDHRCGGALVDNRTVITAAHCLHTLERNRLQVRLGGNLREGDGDIVPIKRAVVHASYNKADMDYDIAVIRLENEVTFTDKIQPVGLPEQDEAAPVGDYGAVSGFGRLSEGGPLPTQLQALKVPILEREACQTAYGSRFTKTMICGGFKEGKKDACQQDSGGPFVVNDKLVGVISWAYGCARPGLPGVYSNVAYFRDWIDFAKDL